MRIISGTFRGRHLSPPKNITARPTTDFAKESLFNLIINRFEIEDCTMLDLFAGTGGIGLEFVSRGAKEVTSVELAHVQQNFILSCCKQLNIRNLNLIRGDVFRFVAACNEQFDFIYADPPYALDKRTTLPDLIFGITPEGENGHSLLREGGIFVLEHSKEDDYSSHPHFVERRSYGSVNFSFFGFKDA